MKRQTHLVGALIWSLAAAQAAEAPMMFIGTEYPYPVEYEVWHVRRGAGQSYAPVFIPTKFVTRSAGTTVGSGPNFIWSARIPEWSATSPYGMPPASVPRFERIEYKVRP